MTTAFEKWLADMACLVRAEAIRRGTSPAVALSTLRAGLQLVVDLDFPGESAVGLARLEARLNGELSE